MSEYFNNLTPPQLERLSILMEELSEASQIIGKILRHGYESHHPQLLETNRSALERELGDVCAAMELIFQSDDINNELVEMHMGNKLLKFSKGLYLHHQDSV